MAAGSLHICAGDRLNVRYTIANQGSGAETVREELWFHAPFARSIRSGKVFESRLAGSASVLRERAFTVPSPPLTFGGAFWLEVRVAAIDDPGGEESVANNAIPMRAGPRFGSPFECRRIGTGLQPPPRPWDFEVHDCEDPMAAGIPICP